MTTDRLAALEARVAALEDETPDVQAVRLNRNDRAARPPGASIHEHAHNDARVRKLDRLKKEIELFTRHIRALERAAKSHPHFVRAIERGEWSWANGTDPKLLDALHAAGTDAFDTTGVDMRTLPGLLRARCELADAETERELLAREVATFERQYPETAQV